MRRCPLFVVVVAVAVSGGFRLQPSHEATAAEARQSGYDLFQQALAKERAAGQIEEAIRIYQRIVRDHGADRALVAKALVQIGRCYETLGRNEARAAYERVVREFADQPEPAADARIRLAALARMGIMVAAERTGGMSSRLTWTVRPTGTIHGNVSHDGRYVPYVDWGTPAGFGQLFLHDLRLGDDRQITEAVKNQGYQLVGDGGTFSPDDTEFAYSWFNGHHLELRIVGLQTAGMPRPRIVFSNPEVSRIWPQDWSADGKWLGVQLQRNDRTAQIGVVAAHDGSLRVLKSVDWRGSSKLFFSPDSQYVAYDLPTSDAAGQRDVFVLAVDGSREIPAVVHPANDLLMGWSPDGRWLLFTSDRTGATGLWSLAFKDGQPQGAPEQIKADVAGASMGVTGTGTLLSYVHYPSFSTIRSDIQVAEFDFASGQFRSTPEVAVDAFVGGNNFPAWSPDGKFLAFLSRRGELVRGSSRTVVGVLSPDTGRLRELEPPLNIYGGGTGLRWSPDGRSLAVQATDSKGRQGIFRIDAETGEAAPIALSSRGVVGGESFANPMWAPDGKTLYYKRVDPSGPAAVIVERDLSSGEERDLFRRTLGPTWNPHWMFVDLSPDGRLLAAVANEAWPGHNSGKWSVVLISLGGGEPRELMHGESQGAGVLTWAPDSRSILVYSIKDQSAWDRELWQVRFDGTEPRRLEGTVNWLGPPFNSDQQVHVHPDGRRVAFAAAKPAKSDEVWALENFLPTNGPRGGARQRGARGERR